MNETFDVCIRIGREFGFPIAMLVWVTYLVSRAASTLHQTVLIPMVASHKTFLDSTTETLKTLGRTQERQAETLEEIACGQRDIQRVVGAQSAARGEGVQRAGGVSIS